MDEHPKDNNNQYQKSKSGFQCLGPCYKPGTIIIHPLVLEYVTDNEQPFCPVKEWEMITPTGQKHRQNIDGCRNPVAEKNISKKELEMNMLIPYIDFNCEQFLKIYYNIFSFADAMLWLERQNHVPINNKIRIIECCFNVFGSNIDVVDYRISNFIIDLVKSKWIGSIYNSINKYIGVKDNSIYLSKPELNKLQINEYKIQRINYIIETFINDLQIEKFLEKYFKLRKEIWDDINSHLLKIHDDLIDYIIEKINKTL